MEMIYKCKETTFSSRRLLPVYSEIPSELKTWEGAEDIRRPGIRRKRGFIDGIPSDRQRLVWTSKIHKVNLEKNFMYGDCGRMDELVEI